MALKALSRSFRESDGQYTTISISRDGNAEDLISAPVSNQTITVAFNKSRDDLGALINANRVVKSYSITVEYLDIP